jgi:hypothetical protein
MIIPTVAVAVVNPLYQYFLYDCKLTFPSKSKGDGGSTGFFSATAGLSSGVGAMMSKTGQDS